MATGKAATLTFHIEPGPKEALRIAAEQERRSIVNMIEVMILGYCGRNGITIQEQQTLRLENERKPQPPELYEANM